jgi:hypothetical protein
MPAPMSQASSATAAKSQKNNKQKGVGTIGSNPFSLILPIAYCLLPIAYCLSSHTETNCPVALFSTSSVPDAISKYAPCSDTRPLPSST